MGNIRNYSMIILFAVLLLATAFASSCQNEEPVSDVQKEEYSQISGEAPATKLAYIYNVDLDTYEKEAVAVLFAADSSLTPDVIMNYLITCFKEKSLDVKVNNLFLEENLLIVDFASDFLPVISENAELETAMLDAIGQSFVDNIDDIKGVVFRIDGNAYANKHFSLGLNEVYLNK